MVAKAELVWENPEQEFQRIGEDRELAVSFAFRNGGRTPVTITKVTTSCGCTTAELAKKTYQPGESGELPAKFVFGGRRGPQVKSIVVTTDDQKTTQLEFKCFILDDSVSLSQALVWWRVGEAAKPKQVDLTLGQGGKVKIVAVTSSNPRVAATLLPVKEGEKYAVTIQPVDTAQRELAEVIVQTNYPPAAPKAYTIYIRVK